MRDPVRIEGAVHPIFPEVIELASVREDIFLPGPAGCGKSHLAKQVADALGLRFGSISCSAGMSESQLLGRMVPAGEHGQFEFQTTQFLDCYENGGVFLLDEIDAADSNVLLVINAAFAFEGFLLPYPEKPPDPAKLDNFGRIAPVLRAASSIIRPALGVLPKPYIQGLSMVTQSDREGPGPFVVFAFGFSVDISCYWRRAASITTVALILFYSYGHIYILIKGINLSEIYWFRHRVLIPIWAGIGTFALWKMSRGSFNPETMTYLLNTMGLILCILPIYQLISSPFQGRLSQMDAEKEAQALELLVGSAPPDIYYNILDGYGREDVLKDRYGFDNSDFLNTLRNLGFYVADCSQSNYSQTQDFFGVIFEPQLH